MLRLLQGMDEIRYSTERSSTGTGTAVHTGPNSLFVQEKIKEVYVKIGTIQTIDSMSRLPT